MVIKNIAKKFWVKKQGKVIIMVIASFFLFCSRRRARRAGVEASGQKGRGFGGRNFCPLALSAPKARLGWERFRHSAFSGISKQKNFLFLN
ncbi:MAG: hypothetical protein COV62_02455 [Candidatus Nealsonbacteria bacterium CG11_big_fil_rev_8_21_14_0_20_35_11]|uniref:Uncharacterized protein n=1 Tax=Candidatus Nealsonbacteria bacterium CG11_big_fil_rev_8_21_14_0_20_35_11 TaxID=1974713 RepID=A0A2H0MZE8_9BACT|nr:MAG: hypothetical protein COV62_02455 [Candidatus Nealsonbacteria bacterium CG11_big_fil_rev_8_21_14_0_20_35_11]